MALLLVSHHADRLLNKLAGLMGPNSPFLSKALRKDETCVIFYIFSTITFFAVLPFVARVADACPHDAGPVAAARDVNALVGGNVALRTLPAAVTHAATFKVLTVPTAQHRAGGF